MQEMYEMWVRSLDGEDPLEDGVTTHSSILAWRIPLDRGAWRATVHGVAKSQTRLKRCGTRATTAQSFTLHSPVSMPLRIPRILHAPVYLAFGVCATLPRSPIKSQILVLPLQ